LPDFGVRRMTTVGFERKNNLKKCSKITSPPILLPTLLQHVVVILPVIKPLPLLTTGSVIGGDGKPEALPAETADDHGDPAGDFGCRSIHDNEDGGDFDRWSHDHSCRDFGSYGNW